MTSRDMQRTAVVTGATQGLGLRTAEVLAALPGWRVVLAVRDGQAGATVAERVGAAVVPLDLASLASVHLAADTLGAEHAPIDALVLNAGIQVTRADRATADGFELTFGVNHLGHFLLTTLLHDRGALAPDARIAVVASGTHFGTWAKSGPYPRPIWRDPRELARPDGGSGQIAYATSKLANVLFTLEAARRYAPIAVNAFDPGLMPDTRLVRGYPPLVQTAYVRLAPLLRRLPGVTRPEASGRELGRLVTHPDFAGVSGRYFDLGGEVAPSPLAQDQARAQELWTVSELLLGGARGGARGTRAMT